MEILVKSKKDLTDAIGLLDQLTYSGQRNTLIVFNIFRLINDTIANIELQIEEQKNIKEIEKLNSEVPK